MYTCESPCRTSTDHPHLVAAQRYHRTCLLQKPFDQELLTMGTLEHHIDPDPDTVIILRNPCLEFAPWEEAPNGKNVPLVSDLSL
jgi:hypothetical protein